MALSPEERRRRRDERARQRINPDTGQPFASYNQLDTWQRNQKAKAQGYRNRAEKRKSNGSPQQAQPIRSTPQLDIANQLPNSFQHWLNGRPATEREAAAFNRLFTRYSSDVDPDEKFLRRAERERILGMDQSVLWPMWRNEYDAIYG